MDAAYCQFALCGPSRTSFLTSRHPDHMGVWSNKRALNWRHFPERKNVYSMPQYFKASIKYRTSTVHTTQLVFLMSLEIPFNFEIWAKNTSIIIYEM